MAKKTLKVPKMKGYAGGGPVTDFSWDDYYKRLESWKDANAQNVPQDIVDYESKWIVPQIKTAQETLNTALATKYNLQSGQAPNANQFLTADEAKAAIGDDAYAQYLKNVEGYQSYRDKVAGSYKAPANTAGAFDPSGEKYGPRHFNLFTLTPEQVAANVATTKAAGKPTSQAEADALAAQPATTTTTETSVPQNTTPTGGIMVPPGKEAGAASQQPASTTDQVQAPVGPQYTKHISNYGPTMYYVQKDGQQQQVSEQEFKTGSSSPDAQVYVLDESTGLYDEQGQPKKPVLEHKPEPKVEQAPPKLKKGGVVGDPEVKPISSLGGLGAKQATYSAAFKLDPLVDERQKKEMSVVRPVGKIAEKKGKQGYSDGGKIAGAGKSATPASSANSLDKFLEYHGVDMPKKKKGYADGGIVPPDSLTGDQLIKFESLATDAEKRAYLDSVAAGTDGDIPELTNKQKAIASIAPVAGQLGATGVNMIDVDPLNKNGNIAQGAGAGALKGAGTGLTLGMNPALMAATAGLSAPVGAAVGAVTGAVVGGIKGKKKYEAAKGVNDETNRQNAMAASYKDSGYAGGGYAGGKLASKATPREAEKKPMEQSPLIIYGGDVDQTGKPFQSKRQALNDGGSVVGPGTVKSDDIPARVQKGSFIVPAENAKMAQMLREQYLSKSGGKAKLNQGGNTDDVYLSNGEHMFTPQEVKVLKANKIDVDGLAPNSETTGYGYADGGGVGEGDGDHGDPDKVIAEFTSLRQQWIVESDPEKKKSLFQQMSDIEPDYEYWKANPDAVAQYKFDKAGKDPSFGKDTATVPDAKSDTSGQAGTPAKKESPAPAQGNKGAVAKSEQPTADQKAIQDAFIKEHGGIDGGGGPAATPAEGESRFKAVATDPLDELLKKYDELLLAGKVGEATEIEQQIKDLGGQQRLTQHKSKAATGKAATFIPPADAVTTEEANAADSAKGIPFSPIKRAYETIGPAGVLAIGQVTLGTLQSLKNKAPVAEVDPVLLQRRNEALQQAQYGLSPAEYSNAANRIESNRANVMRAITGVAGGDVGTIVGNARMASIDANRSRLDLEAANQRMQQQNGARADNLTAAVASQRQQIFAQNMQMFNTQQQASAQLMNAGLENLFGSISSRENQNRIDDRANKYGTVNFTFPSTP